MEKERWFEMLSGSTELMLHEVEEPTLYDDYYIISWRDGDIYHAVDAYSKDISEAGTYSSSAELKEEIETCLKGNKKTFGDVELPAINLTDGWYISKRGLTDLFDDSENALREALSSGKDFDTGWCDCQKEIQSMRIRAMGKTILVETMDSIDEFPDLADDAADELEKGREVTEEEASMIEELCIMDGMFATEASESKELPRNTTYDDLMTVVDGLIDECMKRNANSYEICKSYTGDVIGVPYEAKLKD